MPMVDVYCTYCSQSHEEEWTDEQVSQMLCSGSYPPTGECYPPCEQLKQAEARIDQEVWERTRWG